MENNSPVCKTCFGKKSVIKQNPASYKTAVIQIILGRSEDVRQQVISQPEQTSSPLMCLFCLEALPAEVLRLLLTPLLLSSVNPPITGDRTQNRGGLVPPRGHREATLAVPPRSYAGATGERIG